MALVRLYFGVVQSTYILVCPNINTVDMQTSKPSERNTYRLQGGSFEVWVVVLLLCPSRVANKGDVVDCDAVY